ncbi:D-ribitol-5-phosphate cytidylyltransferase isoform X1 [Conger conger]|uniref:D-ribitol-5-phosphate cytidylyltransferase isoform X1 n=1 Tax=Conger conger TaxID=82655 RepID=UPI002A598340|nr:D-ribitol-5-phosphate cytidylyltransferase isoform X1 [Conger conger]
MIIENHKNLNMETKRENVVRPIDPANFLTEETGSEEKSPGCFSIDFTVAVVLPAGGSGERTGLSTPKQFCTFLNRPLISYTIQAFERIAWIENIVVVVAKDSIDLMVNIIQQFGHKKVKVVLGGSTRHRSIFNGLQAFGESEEESALKKPKVVIIHDAVRPFVEEDFLLKIAIAAKQQGASGAIRPLVSTVIATTSEGYLDHSLERAKYRASEMPQGFLYDVIHQAYVQCSETDFEFGTECLHLVLQYCGTNARLIEGPHTLWKVTYKKDLLAAESIIKETLAQTACVVAGQCEESSRLAGALQKTLGSQDMHVDIVPTSLRRSSAFISKTWNFVHVTVNSAGLADVEELVKTFEETAHSVLYSVVLILVHLDVSEQTSASERMAALGGIRSLAAEAKRKNILLYGILLNPVKDAGQWEEAVENLSQIISALIKERSPALAGQLLWV